MNRRKALFLLAAGTFVVSLPVALRHYDSLEDMNETGPLDFFLSDIDAQAIKNIGDIYLSQFPDESRLDSLLDNIMDGLSDTMDTGTYLRDKVRADFNSERIITLSDWMLSKTEGQILAALTLYLRSAAGNWRGQKF